MNFIRRLIEGNLIFQAIVLKFGELLAGYKVSNKRKSSTQ